MKLNRAWYILPWTVLALLFLGAFGPFTNTIQRTWPGVSNSVLTYNVAVSPTALPTTIEGYDNARYSYDQIGAAPTANAFSCCTYGSSSGGTPAATPQATASACATGRYMLPNVPYLENRAPSLMEQCITVNGTVTFSGNNYK